MNAIYIINYFIFSVFLTLFMVEVGLALLTLFDYKNQKGKINQLINPLWEVTGTFAVFYIVNFEVSYPTLLTIIGTAYAVPLLIAAIFVALRNIFIVLSEHIGDDKSENRLRFVYSISTLVAAIIAVSVLSSGLSGIGISSTTTTAATLSFIFNPFNLLMLIVIILVSFSLANGFIKPEKLYKIGLASLPLAFVIALGAAYGYLPVFAKSLASQIIYVIIAAVFVAMSTTLQLKKSKRSGMFNLVLIALTVNIFGAVAYPTVLGTQNITNYVASAALAGPEILITLVGGAIISISLLAFVYVNYMKKASSMAGQAPLENQSSNV